MKKHYLSNIFISENKTEYLNEDKLKKNSSAVYRESVVCSKGFFL